MDAIVSAIDCCPRRVVTRAPRALTARALALATAGLALVLAVPEPAAAQAPEPSFIVLSRPGKSWGIGISLQDFVIAESHTRPDGQARMIKADRRAAGMILSAFVVPAPAGDSARACRDAFWQRLQGGPAASSYRDVRQSESGDVALKEYTIDEIRGVRIDQRHVHAYLGKDGSCADIHLSKTLFEPKDQEPFNALLRTVRLVEAVADLALAAPTARAYQVSASDAVEVMVPASWQDDFPGGSNNPGPTLTLAPATTKDLLLVMTVLVPPTARRDGSYNAPDAIRKRVESAGQRALANAVEDKLTIDEVKGPEVVGYSFTVTEKKPTLGPTEFRHMTHAQAGLRDVMLTFSLFFQGLGMPERAAALDVLKSARLVAGGAPR